MFFNNIESWPLGIEKSSFKASLEISNFRKLAHSHILVSFSSIGKIFVNLVIKVPTILIRGFISRTYTPSLSNQHNPDIRKSLLHNAQSNQINHETNKMPYHRHPYIPGLDVIDFDSSANSGGQPRQVGN